MQTRAAPHADIAAFRRDDPVEDARGPPRPHGAYQRQFGFEAAHVYSEHAADFAKGEGVAAGFPRVAIAARRSAFGFHPQARPRRVCGQAIVAIGNLA
jgi:hypothetical protein